MNAGYDSRVDGVLGEQYWDGGDEELGVEEPDLPALMIAAKTNSLRCLGHLLKLDDRVDVRKCIRVGYFCINNPGLFDVDYQALHIAVEAGNLEAVERLLKYYDKK